MNTFIALLLFAGLLMVVHSIYQERYERLKREVRVEYRFIPRTLYEEQLAQSDTSGIFRTMFNEAAPWAGEARVPQNMRPRATGKNAASK